MGRDKERADYNSEEEPKCNEEGGGENKMIPDSLKVPQKSNSGED